MTNYEAIYDQAWNRGETFGKNAAGIAAVVAAAKEEALTNANNAIHAAGMSELDKGEMQAMAVRRTKDWADGVIFSRGVLRGLIADGVTE